MLKLMTAGTALLLATPAMANHGADLRVHNHWEAPVRVELDGYAIGTLAAHGESGFQVRPGHHTVTFRAMNGTVLEQTDRVLHPRRTTWLEVDTPITLLVVTNTGNTPLFIHSDNAVGVATDVWIEPGSSTTARIPAGKNLLTASVLGHRGRLETVDTSTLWAEPGRTNHASFRHVLAPSRLTVRNHEPTPMKLYVDGAYRGTLAPGAQMVLDVTPGRHTVEAWGRNGSRLDQTVLAGRGTDTAVDLFRPRPSRPATVAYSGPSRPHRH